MSAMTPAESPTVLQSLLKLLARAAGCDGVILYGPGRDTSTLEGVESFPAGMLGRHASFSESFLRMRNSTAGGRVQATAGFLLPSLLTRWLGGRPSFVCSARCGPSERDLSIFLWWREMPSQAFDPEQALREAQEALTDCIAQQAEENDLDRARERLETILANVTLGLVFTDSLRGSRINPIAAEILRIPEETRDTARVAAAMTELRGACVVSAAEAAVPHGGGASAEYWISTERGLALRVESHAMGEASSPSRFWVFTDVKPLWASSEKLQETNDKLTENLARLAEEVEKRLQAEAELRLYNRGLRQENEKLEVAKLESDLLANQDSLTGLSNRRHFHRVLQERLRVARLREESIAVLFLDLDKFKEVNDALGHDRGDDLLRTVAGVLVKSLRGDDLIARLGGDEFACATTLTGKADVSQLHAITRRILEALRLPVGNSTETIWVGATLGVAVFPEDAEDVEGLLTAADKAMYLGKRQGGDEAVFYRAYGKETPASRGSTE